MKKRTRRELPCRRCGDASSRRIRATCWAVVQDSEMMIRSRRLVLLSGVPTSLRGSGCAARGVGSCDLQYVVLKKFGQLCDFF
jgi:hypothetical protein